MLSTLKIRHLAAILPIIAALFALTAAPALAAPGPLTFSPKKPAAGERVTVKGKGFKKRARYKIIVNDKTYKRSYKTSKHGRLKFSFRMPTIPNGQAIFVAAKVGKVTSIAEIFIADAPLVGDTNTANCEASKYPPFEDGTCPDWDFEDDLNEDDPDPEI
ncbi:MAG: hypothetical protein JHD02_11910 [Thermoleophilaceae bacterium]|nr:hypothetical protein [Thermoleophilaceae bacterium]